MTTLPWERFADVLSQAQEEELRSTVERASTVLAGRVVWNVSSTARGGGVAEMLQSLIAYSRGGGVDARWVVIEGNEEFFRLTKRLHNRLHGADGDRGPLGDEERRVYEAVTERNALALEELVQPGDIVLLHDPQTAGLAGPMTNLGARVIWRCHVGVDVANGQAHEAWRFLLPYVRPAAKFVFSRESFAWDDLDRDAVVVIPPSIDAFSAKNEDLDPKTVSAILRCAGIEMGECRASDAVFVRQDGTPGRVDRTADMGGSSQIDGSVPLVVQVSRWDRLKDPAGVLTGFVEGIAPRTDAHLLIAGPVVAAITDDPEGLEVFEEMRARRAALPGDVSARVHLVSLPMDDQAENAAMVNALQRRATVVVQKSLAEGFGLTVAEAMWKGAAVVASRVGGIQDQIRDGETGLLVDPRDPEAYADAVVSLIEDPDRAARMGAAARDEIRDLFLGARHLKQYVDLCEQVLGAPAQEAGSTAAR